MHLSLPNLHGRRAGRLVTRCELPLARLLQQPARSLSIPDSGRRVLVSFTGRTVFFVFPFLAVFAGKKYLPWLLGAIIAIQLPLEQGIWASGALDRCHVHWCLDCPVHRSPLYQAIRPQFSRAWHKHILQAFLIVLLMVLPAEPTIVRFSTGLMAIVCGLLVWLASYDTPTSPNEGIWNRLTLWIASRSLLDLLDPHECIRLYQRRCITLCPWAPSSQGATRSVLR